MAVWFMRRLQGLFHAEIATYAGNLRTPTMTVETTCCARENVRVR
jgi:hypothetical protein